MDSTTVAWLAVGLLLLTAPALMILRDWRWILGLLAAAYLAMFILVLRHWPIAMAVASHSPSVSARRRRSGTAGP